MGCFGNRRSVVTLDVPQAVLKTKDTSRMVVMIKSLSKATGSMEVLQRSVGHAIPHVCCSPCPCSLPSIDLKSTPVYVCSSLRPHSRPFITFFLKSFIPG